MLYQGKQFLPYAAGDKVYGGGSDAPNMGPVNPLGYRDRDLKYQARRTALQRRLKAASTGDFANPDWGRTI